jgi:hypothetical protein
MYEGSLVSVSHTLEDVSVLVATGRYLTKLQNSKHRNISLRAHAHTYAHFPICIRVLQQDTRTVTSSTCTEHLIFSSDITVSAQLCPM